MAFLGTPVAQIAVGTAGLLFITDDGHTVRFYVRCTDGATRNSNYTWFGNINGVPVSGSQNLTAGFYERLLWAGPVTSSLQVQFAQNATGTQGLGGASNYVTAYISRASVPPAPAHLGYTNITRTSFTLNFVNQGTGNLPISYWESVIAEDANFTVGVRYMTHAFSGQHTYIDLDPRKRYWGAARGFNALGGGPYSATLTCDTYDYADTPPAPVVFASTQTTVTVTVNNPVYIGPGPTTRTVELWTIGGTVPFKTVTEPVQNFQFTGLTRGTTYRMRQKIDNAVGNKADPWSAWTEFMTPVSAPTAPTGYLPFDVASTSAYSTLGTIADNGGQAPSNVRVQFNQTATDVGATTVEIGAWGSPLISRLAAGNEYYYRLAAANSAGWSPWGPWVPLQTKINVPNEPTGLSVTSLTNTSALLNWVLPNDLHGSSLVSVRAKIGTNKVFSAGVQDFSLSPDTINQALGNLIPGQTYHAVVWTTSSNGIGSSSNIFSFTTLGGSGAAKRFWMRISGVWRRGTMWIRVGGVWKIATPWMRISGVWKKG